MNSDVVWLYQIMSILLAMSKFCFAHAEHNLIKFKLYNNWSAQAVAQFEANQICSPLKISQSINVE